MNQNGSSVCSSGRHAWYQNCAALQQFENLIYTFCDVHQTCETLAESRFIFIVAVTNQRKKEVKQAAVSLYTLAKRAQSSHHFV